jgi:hypothetical protein
MSKSKQQNKSTQALRRCGQSLPLEPLDIEQRFIDDLVLDRALHTAHCTLHTAHCPLLTAHRSLLTAFCLLPCAYCLLVPSPTS